MWLPTGAVGSSVVAVRSNVRNVLLNAMLASPVLWLKYPLVVHDRQYSLSLAYAFFSPEVLSIE